jgi:hypothetical protein
VCPLPRLAGFVLWYAVPPVGGITEWTGTPGAIMSLYGLGLAICAAFTEGLVSCPLPLSQ